MAARSIPATHQAATTTRDAVVASCSPTLSPKPKSWRQRTSGCATNSRKQKPSCTSNVERYVALVPSAHDGEVAVGT